MAVAKTTSRTSKTVVGTNPFNWLAIIAIGWVILIGLSAYERYRPASDWLEIKSLTIEDTKLGEIPVIHYNRVIKQPFAGHWIAEVQKKNLSGLWTATCIATGEANYSPDKEPPNPLLLSWWTFPIDCTPTEIGTYRLTTTWQINWPGHRLIPDNLLFKTASVVSDTFEVF